MKKILVLALMAMMTMTISAQNKKGAEKKQCCVEQKDCCKENKQCCKDKKSKGKNHSKKGNKGSKANNGKKTDAQTGATKQQ